MATISGRLVADLLGDGSVNTVFLPNEAEGTAQPLLAKNLAVAEQDFVSTFSFTPQKAKILIGELNSKKHVEAATSIDEAVVRKLFVRWTASA
jgi:hypothetical protein